MGTRIAARVLLIGWDAADWRVVQPLLDAGDMPHLDRLVREGVMGSLAALRPPLSPALWTSVATGRRPHRHGILGYSEPRGDDAGIQPASSTSVRTPTLWRIMEGHGLRSAVVNWFATHPADHAGSIVVSDQFSTPAGFSRDSWPLPPRTVAPMALQQRLAELRVHPADLTRDQLLPFVPRAAEIDQQHDGRLAAIACRVAECATVHAAGTWLAEHERWDLLAVRYGMLEPISHAFMTYRGPGTLRSEKESCIYRDVVDNCYRFHDMMLGRYMRLVGPDTTVMLVSDHGFFTPDERPVPAMPKPGLQSLALHRPHGIFVARGPIIKQDELVFGGSLLDIAPTVLTLLGLPVARDMEGRPLLQILQQAVVPEFVPTYAPADPAEQSADDAPDPGALQQALDHLAQLGYTEPMDDVSSRFAEQATADRRFMLAEAQIASGEWLEANALLEEVIQAQPGHVAAALRLAQCRLNLGDVSGGECLLQDVVARYPDSPWVPMGHGLVASARGDWEQAVECFEAAERRLGHLAQPRMRVGHIRLRQRRWDDAEADFRRALERDDGQPQAYSGLGLALYAQGRYEEAMEALMRSIGLEYAQPAVHYHLGLAQMATGRMDAASRSLRTAIELDARLPDAYEALARIRRAAGDERQAALLTAQARSVRALAARPAAAAATGAPDRSGTPRSRR